MTRRYPREKMEVSKRHWERTTMEAFKPDPLRIVIELIKNSADSYYRLMQEVGAEPPFKIWMVIEAHRGDTPHIEVRDHAEGMNSEKLKKALIYGTEVTDFVGSAEKGIGLKDSLMAMAPYGSIKTIKDDRISGYEVREPGYQDPTEKNEEVSDKEREKLEIPNDGTVVEGKTPNYFKLKRFSTIVGKLSRHFMLRKLLQLEEYEIYVINKWSQKVEKLEYKPPEIDEVLMEDDFNIRYKDKNYGVKLTINRSKEKLRRRKPYGRGGLIFYYGDYSVIEHSLGDFSRDPATERVFGEVKLDIKDLLESEEEIIVDEKRKGLDETHEFNKLLLKHINERLKEIVESEKEESEYELDSTTTKKILRKINELTREALGKGPRKPITLPVKPNTFAFAKPHMSVKELEEKRNYLIVNLDVVPDEGLEITIGSSDPDIRIKRGDKILLARKDFGEDEYVTRVIPIVCKKAGLKGEIYARTEMGEEVAGIESLENPIFSPKDGFAFVPNETKIVDDGEKEVDLVVDPEVIRKDSKEISLGSSSLAINCPGKWMLPDKDKIESCRYKLRNILKIPIKISVKGKGNVGLEGKVKARYRDLSSELKVKVISDPSFGGLFNDVESSPEEAKKVVEFDSGILKVYYKHPLMQKYMAKKGFEKRKDFLTFSSDALTREACRAIVNTAVESGSSQYPVMNPDNPSPEIEDHTLEKYRELGPKLHDMFSEIMKTFKLRT